MMNGKKTFEQPIVAENTIEELSRKLLKANEELKKAENSRKMMLENISHDLRAPLTAIRSTIDYFKHKSYEEKLSLSIDEMNYLLSVLDVRTKTLEVLINDLYYLTVLESNQNVFDFVKIPLGQFLEEYFFSLEIDERYVDYVLRLDFPENFEVTVNIDVAKMSRVLDNLFTNARKYSDLGTTITLGAMPKEEMVCFYVKDNGRGIPKDAIQYIFERTYRVSESRTPDKEAGSGLGLSIAKTIVIRHGGNISCVSKEGEGSCFFVDLPMA